MTAVTVLLIDSRLQADRQVRSEVLLTSLATGTVKTSSWYRYFTTVAADYRVTEPLFIDIDEGMWILEFTSYLGTRVGCTVEVAIGRDTLKLDAADLEGHPTSDEQEFSYKSAGNEQDSRNRSFVSEKLEPRRFVASSASSGKTSPRDLARHQRSSWPKASLLEYAFIHDGCRAPKQKNSFSSLSSFGERLSFWLDGWEKLHHFENIDWKIGKTRNGKLITGKTTVRVESSEHHMRARRLLLILQFQEEHYILMLPGTWGDSPTSTFDVEVDYYGSEHSKANGRVVQARVLTDEPGFNGLAQLLGSGNLYNARNIWSEGALELLYRKYENPVAAAAGALILVQPDVAGNPEVWERNANLDRWFLNLYNDFKWLAEGAICLAWLKGTSAYRSSDDEIKDNEELASIVARLLQEAADRGLPMYTEGLKLLSQGIDWAGENVSVETKHAVRWLAMSSINAGPFLLLRCSNYDERK